MGKEVNMGVDFSSDQRKPNKEIAKKVADLAEEYFKTEESEDQIKVSDENRDWIIENIPECLNILSIGEKALGFTLILPCTQNTMKLFTTKKINEKVLFEKIKKEINYNNFETIYLCSAFIIPEYRKKGLALMSFKKSIEKIIKLQKRNKKPILFYWPFSTEGENLAKKVAKTTGLVLLARK